MCNEKRTRPSAWDFIKTLPRPLPVITIPAACLTWASPECTEPKHFSMAGRPSAVTFSPPASANFSRLSPGTQRRVRAAMEKLAADSHSTILVENVTAPQS